MSSSQFSQLTLSERAAVRRKAAAQQEHAGAPSHPLLRLQRQVGNATVERLIAQRAEEEEEMAQGKHDPALAQRAGEEEEEMAQGKHDPALAQRAGEEEEMMARHDPALAQRAGEEEEMMAKHDSPAPRVGLEGGPVGSDIESRIESKRGGGAPLDSNVRKTMEGTLGTSFEDVRVHQDAESDALNRSITAKAFTTGSDIFLRRDISPTDTSTVAHEVAHVAQQRTMSGGGGGMTVGAADSSYEHEADAIAAQAFSAPKPEEG